MVKTIIDGGSRSPSWGAWIEITLRTVIYSGIARRSPSWGAWIEIPSKVFEGIGEFVAPPRGERGLKWLRPSA